MPKRAYNNQDNILNIDDVTELLGVKLVGEAYSAERDQETCLGLVLLPPAYIHKSLKLLRETICEQLNAVPTAFAFVTHRGYVSRES